MRRLTINVDELVEAMSLDVQFGRCFLDTHTGEIETLGNDSIDEAEFEVEEAEELKEDSSIVPEWEVKERELARQIVNDESGRYIEIESIESHEAYRWMEQYIATLTNSSMRQRLQVAVDGKGAFRRFKDTLASDQTLLDGWFTFERERQKEWAIQWLEANEIELA